MNLRYGFGIGALTESTARQQLVTQYGFLFAGSGFKEEVLPTEISVALLQIDLMVGMYGTDEVNGTGQRPVLSQLVFRIDSPAQIGRVGTGR